MRLNGVMRRLVVAAESGNAEAQFNLAVALGNLVSNDREALDCNRSESTAWLALAARQGLPRAQLMLAERLAEAAPTSVNGVRACAWYLLAASSAVGIHRNTAREGYERTVRQLSAPQTRRAQRLARLWKQSENRVFAAEKPPVIGRTRDAR
jgi:TPR repeat protein